MLNRIKSNGVLIVLAALLSSSVNSQIMTFDFNGLAGNEVTATSNFNDPNINAGVISRGAGVNPANNANRFNGNDWELTPSLANAITNNHYMEFTITPNVGCDFSVTSITVNVQASGTGPSNMALRSSLDGFTANLGAVAAVPSTSTFTFTQTAVTASTIYRIYMYGATGNAGSGGFEGAGNDIIVNGSTSCGGNSIITGALTGAPFTADCGAGTGTVGSVDFTSTGTFNGPNIYTVELSDATGSFATPTVIGNLPSTANAGNIPFTIPSTTLTSTGYLIRIVSDDPITIGSSSTAFTITQTNPCSITTGAVGTSPFLVNCTTSTTATGTVLFTSTGIFNAGNVYTVELSDATGSFTSPVTIGTLNSTANSGSIPITIPFSSSTGTAYVVRVVSSNPIMVGSTSAVFTITQMAQCLPTIPSTSGLIINEFSNGITGSGSEEYYEFVVAGQCGALVDIRGFILDDNNGTFTTPASYSGTGSGIAQGHFRFSNDAQWASIPVGSLIVIYNAADRNPALPADDPSDLILVDSLYVVPHTSTLFESCTAFPTPTSPDSVYIPCTYASGGAWSPLGIRNSGDAIQVRSPNGDYFHGISYGGAEMSGGPDNTKLFTGSGSGIVGWFNTGDFRDIAQWSSGNAPANETPGLPNNAANLAWLRAMRDTTTSNCPVTVLPVELSAFSGKNISTGNLIKWTTDSERDASHFIVERSTNGKNWENIHYENSVGNSTNRTDYSFVDKTYGRVINYYRLNQFDLNGSNTLYNKYIYIDNSRFSTANLVKIVNVLGQEINADTPGIQIHVFEDGSSKKYYKY